MFRDLRGRSPGECWFTRRGHYGQADADAAQQMIPGENEAREGVGGQAADDQAGDGKGGGGVEAEFGPAGAGQVLTCRKRRTAVEPADPQGARSPRRVIAAPGRASGKTTAAFEISGPRRTRLRAPQPDARTIPMPKARFPHEVREPRQRRAPVEGICSGRQGRACRTERCR